MQIENKFKIRPGAKMMVSVGTMQSKNSVGRRERALGGNAEFSIGNKDPREPLRHTVGGSIMVSFFFSPPEYRFDCNEL